MATTNPHIDDNHNMDKPKHRKFDLDLDRDEKGQFAKGNQAAYKASIEHVLDIKQDIIAELNANGRVKAALRKFDITPGTFYRAVEKDDELKEAIEVAEKVRLMDIEDTIDDVIDNPDKYTKTLTNPIANFTMFRGKGIAPEKYRDNAKPQTTVNILTTGELTSVADVYWKTKQHQPVIEAEHKVLPDHAA